MSSRHEEIARRAALVLASLDPKLPEQTEKVISEADVFDFDEPIEDFDPAAVALAATLVNAAKLGTGYQRSMGEDPSAPEWAPSASEAASDSRADRLAHKLYVAIGGDLPPEKRDAVIAAVVDELLRPD